MNEQNAEYVRFKDIPEGTRFKLYNPDRVYRAWYTKTAWIAGSSPKDTRSNAVTDKGRPILVELSQRVQIDSSGASS